METGLTIAPTYPAGAKNSNASPPFVTPGAPASSSSSSSIERARSGPIVPTHTPTRSATPKLRPLAVMARPPATEATRGTTSRTAGVSIQAAVDPLCPPSSAYASAAAETAASTSQPPTPADRPAIKDTDPPDPTALTPGVSHVANAEETTRAAYDTKNRRSVREESPGTPKKAHRTDSRPLRGDHMCVRTDASEPPPAANAGGYDAVAAAATTVEAVASIGGGLAAGFSASAVVGAAGGAKSINPTTREALDRHATLTGTPTRAAPVAGATHVGWGVFGRFWSSVSAVSSVAVLADILAGIPDVVPNAHVAPTKMGSPSDLSSDHATVMTPPPDADVDVGATPLGPAGMRKISTSTEKVAALDATPLDEDATPFHPTSTASAEPVQPIERRAYHHRGGDGDRDGGDGRDAFAAAIAVSDVSDAMRVKVLSRLTRARRTAAARPGPGPAARQVHPDDRQRDVSVRVPYRDRDRVMRQHRGFLHHAQLDAADRRDVEPRGERRGPPIARLDRGRGGPRGEAVETPAGDRAVKPAAVTDP